MIVFLIVLAFVALASVFIWALCRAAALGDEVVVVALDEIDERWAA